MLIQTVEPTVPVLKVPEVWPAWAPTSAPDRVQFSDCLEPANGNASSYLLLGLRQNFSVAETPAKIAQAPLPVPDSPDLEQDARDLEESENPGAFTITLRGVDESLGAAEALQRDALEDPELAGLQSQLHETAYRAASLRRSITRTTTASGESKILSASVTKSHIQTRPVGRLRLVAQSHTSRRSQSATAISTRRLAQGTRVAQKSEEAAAEKMRAEEHANSLGGLLRFLGQAARGGRRLWHITARGGASRLSELGQRVPAETADLLGKVTRGV